jgi:hypothetical protein
MRDSANIPKSRHRAMAASGQQATFTDASRVFVLNVRNRETNQALPGHHQPFALGS